MYYFNVDIFNLKFDINKGITANNTGITANNTGINNLKKMNIQLYENTELNESINTLKTLNECINNGKIDREFS